MPEHKQPSSVNESSRQGEEARAEQWNWVEATIWAERMLPCFSPAVDPADRRAGCREIRMSGSEGGGTGI
jgi:hypothetical protein